VGGVPGEEDGRGARLSERPDPAARVRAPVTLDAAALSEPSFPFPTVHGEPPPPPPFSPRRRLLIWLGLAGALAGSAGILWLGRRREQVDLQRMLRATAASHRLDPDLVEAIARAESGLNPRAVSPAQAYGLMQLRIGTATEMAKRPGNRPVTAEELLQPELNVELGCRYLRWLMNLYGGDVRLVLMAYNAGPSRVKRWQELEADPERILEEHAFAQTRAYVARVRSYLAALKD